MKILLSPAKSIQTEGIKAEFFSEMPRFVSDSEKLVKKLKKLKPKALASLMDISMDLANLNYSRFQLWSTELHDEWLPAAAIFTGEAYKGLNYNELSETNKQRAQERLRILSGLYGLLKPADLILPYRLEMGTPFQATPKETSLYSFWRAKLTKSLASELSSDEIIINLASAEYSKALDFKKLKDRVITPTFKEFKNGKFSTVMIFAKHARGSMSRYLIENDLEDIEQLKTYNVDNYEFNEAQSSENEWVFVR
ncbi:MAG: peroxide stress protein YaaA [Bacteroidetes bacterium]|nr:peroxide stress protein YaaA [Bacteroidota bacterium]